MFLEMPEKQLAVDLRALLGVLSAERWRASEKRGDPAQVGAGLRKALSSCRKGRAWRWALVLLDDFEGAEHLRLAQARLHPCWAGGSQGGRYHPPPTAISACEGGSP
eukprot:g25826.t1